MEKKTFNQAAYVNEYKKKFYKQYAFRFSLKKDQAIINHLEKQTDKTNYIKSLIQRDIEKSEKESSL
ncbi:hypothetical protein [Holdemania sp. Marseille-P2844]|uniref:hypothetical protein n=1 Tax=Holdemania sp. Marseille-P2844 TaxID=1852366 RepID=UPI00093554A8|nr:hypothetical protein [Holdemania sp. Marseille-P2844]